MKASTTRSFIEVIAKLTEELVRIPTTRIAVSSSATPAAGTFRIPPAAGALVIASGSVIPKKLWRILPKYPDHPTDTAEAPTMNSKIRSHPMIQAMNSPREA
jgi:hypothetical protein